jgi:CDP-glucose 4,6-dehydratase
VHFLVTGHTGFKGAWLTLLLRSRGHEVSGLALDPLPEALYIRADVAREVRDDHRADVRDSSAVIDAFTASRPDVVIHMAAQALVRDSLKAPRVTIETNVIGTMNVLEAVSSTDSVKAHVVVTTDKVYRNVGRVEGYVEGDPLGGEDPYSASKAMAEILTQSWIHSFSPCPTATARAGNVIGGGDVSRDRLLPDIFAALEREERPLIRYPEAIRPWQHVLDAVSGYVALAEALVAGKAASQAWNFGPDPAGFARVRDVADRVVALWGDQAQWQTDTEIHPDEASTLTLDATKARTLLDWHPRLTLEEALAATVDWQRKVRRGQPASDVTRGQIASYERKRG